MPQIKSKHVFTFLMLLSVVVAFVVPTEYVEGRVPGVAALFAPVSLPSGAIAGRVRARLAPEVSADQRSADVVKRENAALKTEVARLSTQLERIRQLDEFRHELGDIRKLCTPYTVVGGDSGPRAALWLQSSSLGELRDGMPVLYRYGMVGKVQLSGVAGARVQLITDAGFRVRVGFGRFDGGRFTKAQGLEGVAEGTGRGAMRINGLTREAVKEAKLDKGWTVILSESDWPTSVQGQVLGKITSIGIRPDAPLFAMITVEPSQSLLRLPEVMVVTRTPEQLQKRKAREGE